MDKKRVLVTGAAGFIGSHLCDRFIKEGYEVIGMDNLLTVNIASRLESHCKQVGKDLLITENTKRLIGSSYTSEFIDNLQVRGRESKIEIYSL